MIKDYQDQERAHLPLVPTKHGTLRSGLGSENGGERSKGKRERGQDEKKLKKFKNQ